MGKINRVYAMYKGDKCLGVGTVEELSKQLNVIEKTIRFYLTPSYRKRFIKGKNRRELIIVD